MLDDSTYDEYRDGPRRVRFDGSREPVKFSHVDVETTCRALKGEAATEREGTVDAEVWLCEANGLRLHIRSRHGTPLLDAEVVELAKRGFDRLHSHGREP